MPVDLNALFAPAALAFVMSATVIWALIRSRVSALALDRPNDRSLHAAPTPRIGGLGILAGLAAGVALSAYQPAAAILLALALIVGVSLADDVRGVSPAVRFPVHLLASSIAAVALMADHAPWPWIVLALLAIAWLANLYNFMDGSDGLAGGMAVIGFGAYGIGAALHGDTPFAAANLAVCAAAAAFLIFNFPPARVFMGDAGSVTLGFLAAVLGIEGWHRFDWPFWFGALVFSPFIADATITLAKRLVRGERVWQAHRSHYYQRLVQRGWGHRTTALAGYALMIACAGLALAGAGLGRAGQWALLAACAAGYCALALVLERRLSAPR